MRTDPLHQNAYPLFLKSVISVLVGLIVIFYFFPDFQRERRLPKTTPSQPLIVLQDLPPRTIQYRPKSPVPVTLPSVFIPIPVEEADWPEELPIEENAENETLPGTSLTPRIVEIPPRPLLEIYPKINDIPCKGEIILFIFISHRGKVLDVQVIKNTTQHSKCLRQTIEAVRHTRWLPGRRNGQVTDMWVKKTFRFQ